MEGGELQAIFLLFEQKFYKATAAQVERKRFYARWRSKIKQ